MDRGLGEKLQVTCAPLSYNYELYSPMFNNSHKVVEWLRKAPTENFNACNTCTSEQKNGRTNTSSVENSGQTHKEEKQ